MLFIILYPAIGILIENCPRQFRMAPVHDREHKKVRLLLKNNRKGGIIPFLDAERDFMLGVSVEKQFLLFNCFVTASFSSTKTDTE